MAHTTISDTLWHSECSKRGIIWTCIWSNDIFRYISFTTRQCIWINWKTYSNYKLADVIKNDVTPYVLKYYTKIYKTETPLKDDNIASLIMDTQITSTPPRIPLTKHTSYLSSMFTNIRKSWF